MTANTDSEALASEDDQSKESTAVIETTGGILCKERKKGSQSKREQSEAKKTEKSS